MLCIDEIVIEGESKRASREGREMSGWQKGG